MKRNLEFNMVYSLFFLTFASSHLPLSKKYLILLNTLAYRITDLSEFVRWLCPLRNCPMRPDKFVWLPQNHVPFLH